MEGRSIIHKMHVLERSFLPELKYSTSHSYRPLLRPWTDSRWTSSLRKFHRVFPSPLRYRHQPRHCRPPSTLPFTPIPCLPVTPSGKGFLSLAGANMSNLFFLRARSIDRRNLPPNLANENFAMHSSCYSLRIVTIKRAIK